MQDIVSNLEVQDPNILQYKNNILLYGYALQGSTEIFYSYEMLLAQESLEYNIYCFIKIIDYNL